MKKLSGILSVSVAALLIAGCQGGKVDKAQQADPEKAALTSSRELVLMNENNTIKECRAFVKAQRQFSYMERIDDSVAAYEPKTAGGKGKKKDLYWVSADGKQSPVSSLLAAAAAEQTSKSMATAYNGYMIKVLTAQGETAPGDKSSTEGGSMTRGYALLAYPAKYGESGVLTFVVSHMGTIYEKNLGGKTPEIAPKTNEYNIDDTWTPVSEN
ncbi:MAG: DUF2950 family protein [Victivallales bacterium]